MSPVNIWNPTIENCNDYLESRTGSYEKRAVRYRSACSFLISQGLDNSESICDIGAGRTEFDYCLRAEYSFRGLYVPIDGAIDGTDLNNWKPPRKFDYFVGLEILEHLYSWRFLVTRLQESCLKGIVVSTPNPRTTDVLGMDQTHVAEISTDDLEAFGFTVEEKTFYGGVFSNGQPDSLFATWSR